MNNYSEELKKLLKQSELEALLNNDLYVTSGHFILALCSFNNSLSYLLNKYNITYDKVKTKIEKGIYKDEITLYNKEFLDVIEEVLDSDAVTTLDVFFNIINNDNTIGYKLIKSLNINLIDMKNELINKANKKLSINEISTDLTKETFDKVIGRDKEIQRVIEILARKNKNNPILIGKAGTGKTAIVEELATRIKNNNVPDFLKGKSIYSISLASLVAGTKYRGEFEEKVTRIIKELECNDNIILFIDEIHSLVHAGGAEGAIDASNILKPALSRGKIKVIGATTLKEYNDTIAKDKALDRRFQKVLIEEPNIKETINILKKIKNSYEKYHNVIVSNKIIETIVYLSNTYIKDRYEPDKSIDLLDEVCAYTSISNNKYKKIDKLKECKINYIKNNDYTNAIKTKNKLDLLNNELLNKNKVTLLDIKRVLENKLSIPIYELESTSTLNRIKKKYNNDLCTKIIDYLSTKRDKPISLTINKDNIDIINDMNIKKIVMSGKDYESVNSINKILGTPQGYVGYSDKTLFDDIKHYPVSIIIIKDYNHIHDTIKKYIDDIINTGYLNLANNTKIDFRSTIFLLEKNRSNIGFINETVSS